MSRQKRSISANKGVRTKKITKTAKGKRKAGKAYLTKRKLTSAARRGIRKAAEDTLNAIGYNVVVQNGWVVRKGKDGSITNLKRLARQKHSKIILD